MPVHHRLRLLAFPMRTAVLMTSTHSRRSNPRYPRFRRDLFARDVALDPGGMTMPRITALHMLRSTMNTVSAPASSSFRGSLPHPTHPLCTLRVRRQPPPHATLASRRPAKPYLGRSCSGWIAPAEQSGAIRCGVGGAKGGDQGECGPAAQAPNSAPHKRVTDAGSHTAAHSCRGYPRWKTVCGKAARTDLCGGCEVTRIPTAPKAPGKGCLSYS